MSWVRGSPGFARLLTEGIESCRDIASGQVVFTAEGVETRLDSFVVKSAVRADYLMASHVVPGLPESQPSGHSIRAALPQRGE